MGFASESEDVVREVQPIPSTEMLRISRVSGHISKPISHFHVLMICHTVAAG
jgi:hypothetical protein